MSIRITLDFLEIKIGDGSRHLISLFNHPRDFYLQFKDRYELKEWFAERDFDDNPFDHQEHLIPFPSPENVTDGMQERLQRRFGTSIKIQQVTDLSIIGKEGRDWGCQNPMRFAKAKPIHKPPYADRIDQSHQN